MNTRLAELFKLLQNLDQQVEGRESEPPPESVQSLLMDMIRSGLSPEKRHEVCEFLRAKPGWLAWFAEQIKISREPGRES